MYRSTWGSWRKRNRFCYRIIETSCLLRMKGSMVGQFGNYSGFSFYHQTSKHYYNSNFLMLNFGLRRCKGIRKRVSFTILNVIFRIRIGKREREITILKISQCMILD